MMTQRPPQKFSNTHKHLPRACQPALTTWICCCRSIGTKSCNLPCKQHALSCGTTTVPLLPCTLVLGCTSQGRPPKWKVRTNTHLFKDTLTTKTSHVVLLIFMLTVPHIWLSLSELLLILVHPLWDTEARRAQLHSRCRWTMNLCC